MRDSIIRAAAGIVLLPVVAFAAPRGEVSAAVEAGLELLAPGQVAELSISDGLWFQGPLGLIGVETSCQASHVAAEMRAADDAFTEHFQAPSVSIAVVDRSLAQHADSLRAAGMASVMPWPLDCPPSADRAPMAPTGLRRPASEEDAAESTVLRHEIGHLLFIYGLWPGTGAESEYGGGAPDWLDEAAAIAMEGNAMTAGRRDAFAALAAQDELIGLDEFFTMPHPRMANTRLRALLEKMRDRVEAGEENVVMQADPVIVRGDRMAEFYAQARGLIDYLVEQSGNRRILMTITRALRDGRTFGQWLAEAGPANGLPTEIGELDRRFRAWAVADR